MASAEPTTNHDDIRRWAEAHGGRPSKVETSEPGGVLRLDFGAKEENLTESPGTSSSKSSRTATWPC
jgi:hypothetical protein